MIALRVPLLLALLCLCAGMAEAASPTRVRSGTDIVSRFRAGLAEPACDADVSSRWRRHFADTPDRLANGQDDALALFGYVVDELHAAHLPSEYALIPFVESGYRPAARSPGGPAGMWQFIALTARNHGIRIDAGYDGRLSPVDSTRAAVRYLKTLHGMFGGNWRLTVMAYNAGENRILGAIQRGGFSVRTARPEALTGLSEITHAYVRKLHALACVLDEAHGKTGWRTAISRQVPLLGAVNLPEGGGLSSWAEREGLDSAMLQRLNPAARGAGRGLRVLAPLRTVERPSDVLAPSAGIATPVASVQEATTNTSNPRTYSVRKGDSLARIARRHGITLQQLLQRNALTEQSTLQPGMVLKID